MNAMDLLFDQDIYTYNINLIGIYILVLIVAFIVCVVISQNMNVYATSYKREIKSKFNIKFNNGNESNEQALKEVAATTEELMGAEDER